MMKIEETFLLAVSYAKGLKAPGEREKKEEKKICLSEDREIEERQIQYLRPLAYFYLDSSNGMLLKTISKKGTFWAEARS